MSEEQSIEINKKTYAKLKKLADINECSVNEEIGNAFTATYEDLDDSVFDEIAIIEKRDSVLLILPTDLYDSFQEEAENNSTEIEEELNLFFEEHLVSSAEGYEDDSEDDEDADESEDETEGDDEPRSKKTEKSKGLFNLITDVVGEFVEDLIDGDEENEHKKKKNK